MMSNLKVINLRSNLIDVIGNYYKMLEDFNLVKLDLSDNRISILEPQIFVVSLNFAPRPHIAYYHQQQKFNLLSKPNAMLVLVGICSVIMAVFTFPNIWRLC